MSVILRLEAVVNDDHSLSLLTHANEAVGWRETRVALQRVGAEIARILDEGAKCPFAPKEEHGSKMQ